MRYHCRNLLVLQWLRATSGTWIKLENPFLVIRHSDGEPRSLKSMKKMWSTMGTTLSFLRMCSDSVCFAEISFNTLNCSLAKLICTFSAGVSWLLKAAKSAFHSRSEILVFVSLGKLVYRVSLCNFHCSHASTRCQNGMNIQACRPISAELLSIFNNM